MISKDMVIRDVVARHPETLNVFGRYKVDFCCGGAHSIEMTARACGVSDIDGLMRELNRVVQENSGSEEAA